MTKLSHWAPSDTRMIYQSVGGLLALLTVMPWQELATGLELLRSGQRDRSQWPVEIRGALHGTRYLGKLGLQAIYWYLIEMIAQQLKSGELRNSKIYEFNPDAVYDPKRPKNSKAKRCDHRAPIPPTGVPPPENKI